MRTLVSLVALATAVATVGCGAADDASDAGGGGDAGAEVTTAPDGGGAGGGGVDRLGDEAVFGFELPAGDTSGTTNLPRIYQQLLDGDCAGAQRTLDTSWRNLPGPQTVLVVQAAIHLCRGDRVAAAPFYRAAIAGTGWTGPGEGTLSCNVYVAVGVVIEQRAKETFACPDAPQDFHDGCDPDGLPVRSIRRVATPDPPTPSTSTSRPPSSTTSSTRASSTTSSTGTSTTTTTTERFSDEATRCDPRRDVTG